MSAVAVSRGKERKQQHKSIIFSFIVQNIAETTETPPLISLLCDCSHISNLDPIMSKRDLQWEARFQELVEYKRSHGNCNVPRVYKANLQLGTWVDYQRHGKRSINEEKRKRLNSIGFTWKFREYISVPWEERFQQLVEYKRVHDNCNVPQDYKANLQLGNWVCNQRQRKATMSDNRRNQLNSIGFTWKVRETPISVPWDVRFQQLVEYKRVHDNCNVPQDYKANLQLGNWVCNQRQRKATMSDNRRNQLNSIGFTWKVRETPISVPWDVRFQELVEYKRVHGDCNIPYDNNTNKPLGNWVHRQRHKRETMSENRKKQFNSIGFVWSLIHQPKRVRPSTVEDLKKKKIKLKEEAAQEDKVVGKQACDSSYFEQHHDFVRKFKHCNVPAQHPEPGRWAEEQRQLYDRKQNGRGMESNLTDEQEVKLMAVGFDFVRTLNIPDDDDIYSF